MVLKQEKFTRVIRGNVHQTVQPKCVILRVVASIEAGELSIKETAQQYEVGIVTVRNWLKKFSSIPSIVGTKKRIEKEAKRKIVREVEEGLLTRKQAAERFGVDPSTISQWVSRYSCRVKPKPLTMQEASTKEQAPAIAEENIHHAHQIIRQLELKIAALETILDLAEKELRFDIRKNFGTKRS